jgi:two-component system LytT family sensor kinase
MTSSSTRFRLSTVAVWWLFGAISGVQIQISMLDHHHSWPLVLGYQVLAWSVWIVYTFAIGFLVHRVPLVPLRAVALVFHVPVALFFAVLHIALWVGVELWLKPYDFMNPTHFGRRFLGVMLYQVPLELLLYGLVALAHHVRDAAERERERERRAAQLETSLAEARLHALRLQIQPHFLFNTLNGISALVRGGQNTEAIGMIGGLSDLLRYSLDRADGARTALAEEVAMVGRYLDVERLRFAERLEASVEVPAEIGRAAVPVLLLQPLVENALRHGVAQSHAPGKVTLRAQREGDALRVEVFNTGRLDPEWKPGIGLSTTIARLEQMYGDRARFELVEENGGVRAWVVLPWSTL